MTNAHLGVLLIAIVLSSPTHAAPWDKLLNDAKKAASDVSDISEIIGGQSDVDSAAQGQHSAPQSAAGSAVPTNSTDAQDGAGSDSDVVRRVEVDGVKLGMPIDKALENLAAHGFKMGPPGAVNKITGVTIEGRGATADGSGYITVSIRHMDGIVYWYDKTVAHLQDRLPDGITIAGLEQKYRKEIPEMFAGARYQDSEFSGTVLSFDDESKPPYNRKITSPHARVSFSKGRSNTGRVGYSITFEWKARVGANW